MKNYKAPWSMSLIVISSLASIVCLGGATGLAGSGRGMFSLLAWLLMAVVGGSALFTIRGYAVTPGAIAVQRLFWATRLPLAGLQSAEFLPDAMRGSIRTFGNGGLFSFTGFYRNQSLGAYRAFVTDPHQTVVLHFSKRTVVLSPSAPEAFVHEIDAASHGT